MTELKNKKRGRPEGYRAVNPHDERLAINVTSVQMNAYKAASKRENKTLSQWVREWLDKAAKK